MLSFNEILKAVSYDQIRYIISTDGVEHGFILTQSGALLYLRPDLNISKVVLTIATINSYGTLFYSYTTNNAYFTFQTNSILYEIDLDTLEVKSYDYTKFINSYVNRFIQTSSGIVTSLVDFSYPTTDGNIWIATIRYLGISNIVKFDVTTKEFSTPGYYADKEFEHIHGIGFCDSCNITTGPVSLRGYYTEYLFTDDYEDLYETILDELDSSGLSYILNENFRIFVHWDDRDLISSTRRVVVRATDWKIIDLKSTSVYIDSGNTVAGLPGLLTSITTWEDETNTPVDNSTWDLSTIADHAIALGVTLPSLNPDYHNFVPTFVGRYPYHNGGYMADRAIFNHFALSPTTGEVLFPNSVNKRETYINNERVLNVYWANMPVGHGFSGDPEYVGFVMNDSYVLGYHRPDTDAWVEYDPEVDTEGYIISQVDLNDPTNPYGLGCYVQYLGNLIPFSYLNQDWHKPTYCKSAINPQFALRIDPVYNMAEVDVEFTTNVNTEITSVATFKGVPTLTGLINSAHQINGKYVFGGNAYAGISIGEVPVADYEVDVYFGEAISIYGSVRWNDLIVFYGYLNLIEIVDGLTRTRVPIGSYVNQQLNASSRSDALILTGVQVRRVDYIKDYFAICYLSTSFDVFEFPNLPISLDRSHTIQLRQETGLVLGEYSDRDVETAISNYQLSEGLTRDQVIDLFLETTPYRAQDSICYDDFVIVNCKHFGPSALQGIRINRLPDLSGDWVDHTYYNLTRYPTIVRIEKSDLSTLVESDYKVITLDIAGFETYDGLGRMYQTDNYVCWFYKEGTDLFFKAISKANIEAATTEINSFDKEVLIPLGTSTGGWGNYENFFGGSDRLSNFCFSEGDNIYASLVGSIASGLNWVIAVKIDVVAETYEPFLISSDRTTVTTMTRNPDTDDAMICRGAGAKMYENISVATLPLTY